MCRRSIFLTSAVSLALAFAGFSIAISSGIAAEAKTELLWPDGAPGAKGKAEKDQPKLILYPAEKAKNTGAAVVICPGGGYAHLAMDHEGHQIAAWLNSLGVTAAICDYRHSGKGYGHPAPMLDAQRAIRTVRARGEALGVKSDRVGVLGFSAGGHLASTVGTHFDDGNADSEDPIERVSSRPDFLILCYPVISFKEKCAHRGSMFNLLGPAPELELVDELSNETQVTKKTPPTFLFHTSEDKGVPPENSVLFYMACQRAGVPAELHIFEKGRHGLGLAKSVAGTADWSNRCADWLAARGLLKAEE